MIDIFFNKYRELLAHRAPTFFKALALLHARTNAIGYSPIIVETGCARIEDNWAGDGLSTLIWADYVNTFGGKFYSVDIDPKCVEFAKSKLAPSDRVELVCQDSLEFLKEFKQPIDLLYLDSMDFCTTGDPNPPQDHALAEAQIVSPILLSTSLMLIDDCGLIHGGKGGKVVPYLVNDGPWAIAQYGYQILLTQYA